MTIQITCVFSQYNIQTYQFSFMQAPLDFQALSQSHQFQVLRYLEMTGSDNIQQAITHLQKFNMNASQAINAKYSGINQSNHYDDDIPQRRQIPLDREQEQELVKYNKHLREQYITVSSPWYIMKYYGRMAKRVARGLTECMMPKWARKAIFYSKFEKMYKDDSQVRLFDRTFDDAFKKGVYDQKCLAVIISSPQKSGQITELLNGDKEIIKLLTNRVVTVGIMSDSEQFKKLKCKVNLPSIAFAFETIFQQLKVMSIHRINEITQTTIKSAITQYRTERRKQKNIVIRYKNRILSRYGAEQEMEEEIPESRSYEYDRLLVQQQKAEYQQASNIRKQSIQKQQEQKRRKQSLVEERKARKISIPDEPTEGDIIVCNFRFPNGTRMDRKFDKNEKVELLYNWVETNEEIEFEEQLERKFELLRGYPPEPLKDKMDMKIKDVIEEDREVILIREL